MKPKVRHDITNRGTVNKCHLCGMSACALLSHTVMMKAWEVSFLSQALWCREITGDWVLRDAEQFSPLQTTAGAATCDVVSGAWDQDLLTWKVLLRAAWAWGASWPGAVVSA